MFQSQTDNKTTGRSTPSRKSKRLGCGQKRVKSVADEASIQFNVIIINQIRHHSCFKTLSSVISNISQNDTIDKY